MVYIFLGDGFEEIEATCPIDILRRAGVDLKIVSVMESKTVIGSHGMIYQADIIMDEVIDEPEMYILPGGMGGVSNMKKCKKLCDMLISTEKYIAAICAAPTLLAELGLLNGKRAICYPGLVSALSGADITNKKVVKDGKIITSEGPGTSMKFGFVLAEILTDKKTTESVKSTMLC